VTLLVTLVDYNRVYLRSVGNNIWKKLRVCQRKIVSSANKLRSL